jgi:tetratricopeptide (TPR) repeat protein
MSILLWFLAVGSQDDASRLVEKLRSEKVEEREEATQKLREMGEAVVPELEKAAKGGDAEAASRAKALLEELTPAGTIQRIEQRLLRLKSAKVRVRVMEVTPAGEEERSSAHVTFKGGNQVSLQVNPGRYWKEGALVCNGKRVWTSLQRATTDAPGSFREGLTIWLVRIGVHPGRFEEDLARATVKWGEHALVQEARFGSAGRGTILFKVFDEEIELTYDPFTLRPLRRKSKGESAFVEIYDEWGPGGEVSDDLFKLPGDRIEEQTRLLEAQPRNAAAWAERGAARMDAALWDEALKDFTRAIEFDPKSFKAYAGRGGLRMIEGKDAEAMPDLDRAIELDPKDSRVRVDRGWARVKIGKFREALEDCTVAVEIDPQSLGAWINRGVARILLDEPAKGLPDFDAAGKIDPRWPTVYSNLALALAMLGQEKEALAQADRALALNALMPYYAHAAKGLVFHRQGRRGEALAEFGRFEERVVPGDPLLPRLKKWKAEAEK